MVNSVVQILGLVAAGAAGLTVLLFLLRRPEVAFALFLFSYVIEGGELIPGPLDLTAIMLFISLAGFFLPAVRGKPIRFSSKSSDLLLFIFLIVFFGGSYLAPDLQDGVTKAALFAVAVFLPYLIVRLFFKTYEQIRIFFITFLGLAIGIAALLIAMSVLPAYVGGRLQFLEANPIPTGTLLAVGLVIAVIGLTSDLLRKSGKSKAFCLAAIPLFLYGVFLSGVRGPLISAIVGLAFYILILFRQRPRLVVRAGVIAILLLVTFNMWHPYVVRTAPNIGGYSLQAIVQGLSTQQRLEKFRAAITLFAQRPVLGGGTDGFAQRTGLGYPHNIFLEIASEMGLIGLIVFMCFLGSIVWSGLRYLAMHPTMFAPQARAIGITVLVISLILLVEKQFSYGLTMHKDLFAFLGIIVNLPIIQKTFKQAQTGASPYLH